MHKFYCVHSAYIGAMSALKISIEGADFVGYDDNDHSMPTVKEPLLFSQAAYQHLSAPEGIRWARRR